jgi:alkylhydroperoxidase family enzyme
MEYGRFREDGLTGIADVAPRVYAALSQAWAAAPDVVDAGLLELMGHRVEYLLGLTDSDAPPAPDALTAQALALTEQFVNYVPAIDETLLGPLRDALGRRGLRALVDALYVVDQTARLRITHGRLFTAGEFPSAGSLPPGEATSLGRINLQMHHEIMLLTALDPLTAEVVRLRAASYHHCRYCMSGRVVMNGKIVVDAELAARIDSYATHPLAPSQQAALRYADAHMIDPRRIDSELRTQLTALFTPRQLVELSLHVTAYNYQKILVALDLDSPVSEAGLVSFLIEPDGKVIVGGPLDETAANVA